MKWVVSEKGKKEGLLSKKDVVNTNEINMEN